jgi:ABC-2 type transport system permease protein
MYALKDYLGEDSLNATLSRYILKTGYQNPPYTTALEFYDYIQAATPDSLRETVRDLFERIVVYDNSIKTWSYKKTTNGKYKITALVNVLKTSSDSLGKAQEINPTDWIDVGVFYKDAKTGKAHSGAGYLKKVKFTKADQALEFETDKEPMLLGIDPYCKLIDKSTSNNIKDVNGKDAGSGDGAAGGVVVSGG